MIYWNTDQGNVLQFNLSSTTNTTSFVPGAQNVTGGLTTASGSNLMIFGTNSLGFPKLQTMPLDVLTKNTGPLPLTQLTNFTFSNNTQIANQTFASITLNGALVTVTDTGIQLYFSPFATTGNIRVFAREKIWLFLNSYFVFSPAELFCRTFPRLEELQL